MPAANRSRQTPEPVDEDEAPAAAPDPKKVERTDASQVRGMPPVRWFTGGPRETR